MELGELGAIVSDLLPEIPRWLSAGPYNSLERLLNTLVLVYRGPPIHYQSRRYSSPNSWLCFVIYTRAPDYLSHRRLNVNYACYLLRR